MDKRTLGGKRKLVFVPKIPVGGPDGSLKEKSVKSESLEIGDGPIGLFQMEKESKEVKNERIKIPVKDLKSKISSSSVSLLGNSKEEPFLFRSVAGDDVFAEDLAKLGEGPITGLNLEKKSSIYSDTTSREEFENESRYLLQMPAILPEDNQTQIRGKLRIEDDGRMTLIVRGRESPGSSPRNFEFSLTMSEMGTAQEAFKQQVGGEEGSKVFVSQGSIKKKLISQIK
ncbi:hypothetical protein NEHOM01_0612 [Nematocida homosporus]|uniref:uncharacterized protein n=1 Tax=Nematocida homosporus TaxID=1912981 RepID=UPI00222126E6|nr:uncharacterized protein NEHOM01_0612 [Nematocida homosporus]KAI5185107.1 hypothetical protein NEHOM01_0612 [Nematocida homosporus]